MPHLFDRLAELTNDDVPDFETVRDLYQSDARLRVDSEIHSYGSAGMEIIEIPV